MERETPVTVSPKAKALGLRLYKEREALPVLRVNYFTVANDIAAKHTYHVAFFL